MEHQYTLVIILSAVILAVTGDDTANLTPNCAVAQDNAIWCEGPNVVEPPHGSWENITGLFLRFTNIAALDDHTFAGFGHLKVLAISNNPLNELHLSVFSNLSRFEGLHIEDSALQRVVALGTGQELPNLRILHLINTTLTFLPENFLDGLPRLTELNLAKNPIVLPGDHPFVTSISLKRLFLDEVNCNNMSSVTLRGVRNVTALSLISCGLREVSDVLQHMTSLEQINLSHNPLHALRNGSFHQGLHITQLLLHGSELRSVETAAVDGIVTGELKIDDTPMACLCNYESLYHWSTASRVTLSATCFQISSCPFVI